ncbi:MAG: hypothetical protein JWN51_2449 [Phycisphaerales bacterium]|nr:hypothetical protein [Phycisphaerales bacterium]
MPMRDVLADETLEGDPEGDRPAPAIEAVAIRDGLEGRHVCPFCGSINDGTSPTCPRCTMENTPAARKATKPRIGPWYVLQSRNPAAPGMKWETLLAFVRKGRVKPQSIVRGPTTHQLWRFAAHVKGLSREFGICYSCGGAIGHTITVCPQCNRLQEPPAHPDALIEGVDEPTRGPVFKEISPDGAPASIPAVPPGNAPSSDDLFRAQEDRENLARELGAIADARESVVRDREEVEEARESFEQERQAVVAEREAIALDRGVFESEKAAVARERAVLLAEREAFERERVGIIRDREIVKLDRETATRERDAFAQNTAALELERQAIAQEREALIKERDAFHQERAAFARERDAGAKERGTFELQQEFVALARDREGMEQEREALASEREAISRERDAIASERAAAARDREAVIRERDALAGDARAFAQEREAFVKQRESVARERDALNRDREAAARARDAVLHERETIDQEREMLDRDRQALHRDRDGLVRNREALFRERQTLARDNGLPGDEQSTTKKSTPALPPLPEVGTNPGETPSTPESEAVPTAAAEPFDLESDPEPTVNNPRGSSRQPAKPPRSLWKDSFETIAEPPIAEIPTPLPVEASSSPMPTPARDPVANGPAVPLTFPSMGNRKAPQRDGFLSAKDLAAAFKLDFAPSAQGNSSASAALATPPPETPEDFKSFVTMLRDRDKPRRPKRKRKVFAIFLLVGTVMLLAAGMGVLGDQAKAMVGKIRQTLSSALPANSATPADPKDDTHADTSGDHGHSAPGNSGALPYPPGNSIQPTPIPTPPAPPEPRQAIGSATAPAVTPPTTRPAPATTLPDSPSKPPADKIVISPLTADSRPTPAATRPSNLAVQSPVAQTPAPKPPERPAPRPGTNSDPAQAQALARAIRGQAFDAEIRGDFAEAARLYEQIKKLPQEAWPADLELRLKLAREQQNQK